MEHIVALIFLFIGSIFGKLVLNQSSKNYDEKLLIGAFIFLLLGSESIVFSSIDVRIMISDIVTPFLLGLFLRRYINKRASLN
ncbi:hypothetical protein D3C81_1126980 [compost metagenome]